MPKANQKQASKKTAKPSQKDASPKQAKEAPKVSKPVAASVPAPVAGKAPQKALPVPQEAPQKQKGAKVGPDPAKVAAPPVSVPVAALKAAQKTPGAPLREVIVGRGPEGLYVSKATEALERYKAAVLRARGGNIVKAVNVLEMLRRDLKGSIKAEITSATETFQGLRGPARVSALAISIKA